MSEIDASLSGVVKSAKNLFLSVVMYKKLLSAVGITQSKTRHKLIFLLWKKVSSSNKLVRQHGRYKVSGVIYEWEFRNSLKSFLVSK